MKADKRFIIFLVMIFVLLVVVEYFAPQPVDWRPSFSKKDKIPYGSYIVHDCLSDVFPGKDVSTITETVYNNLEDSDCHNSNYIFVNSYFEIDTLDMQKLFDYADSGNNVFIAAESFYGALADSLKLKTSTDFASIYNLKDSVSLNFTDPEFHSAKDFRFKKGSVDYYFVNYDTTKTTVLGKNSLGKVNYIKIKHGKGAFYLNTAALAFTNYNALKGENSDYIFRALSYLPVQNTMWDEYYKVNKAVAETPLRFVLNNAALKAAYYTMLLALLLYLIFEGKRKQRIIPIITPLQNTSLEFVETIGLLYYQKGSNLAVGKKKIQFFLEYIRDKFNMQTNVTDKDFYSTLSMKSGVEITSIENLFTFISEVNKLDSIDEASLVQLNNMIEEFYNKTK